MPVSATPERLALEARWLELTRVVLPSLAIERHWPIRLDHCFQRVLLDAAVDDCWYKVIVGRPAYRAAEFEILARAVALANAAIAGHEDLSALNRHSLAWRGKAPRLGH